MPDTFSGDRTAPARAQWSAFVAAVAIVLLGFGLRAAYYHEGYGHPDEPITVEVVKHMRHSGDWDTNWSKAELPADLRYDQYNFSSHLYATYFFYRAVKLLPGTGTWRDLDEGVWVYRFFSVLLATVAVWQTWRLARRLGGESIALLAAALTAVATLLVQDAHYSRPEAFTTVLTLVAVGMCWPREKLYLAAVAIGSLVVGVLVACKVSMLLLAWLPLVPVVHAWRTSSKRWFALVMIPGGILAGFAAGAPGAVAHPAQFINGVQRLATQYGGQHPPHSHTNGAPVGDMFVHYFFVTLGWPLLAAAVVGAVVLARRRAEFALLAGPAALFAGFFSTRTVFFERNVSHVLPLLLIVAALGAATVAGWLARRTGLAASVWLAALAALMVVRPLMVTWPLVAQEFSGRAAKRHDAFEHALRARYPNAVWQETLLMNGAPLLETRETLRAGRGPVLLRVTDLADEWTKAELGAFAVRFDAQPVADYPGTFPDLPTCTLLTYHGGHDRYFLVTASR